ncbi:MAG TPA: PilZ domain-containing protein [Spirochaetia bacterium]|nr:PilZ domain-containing protein [Spirochaetia bacterium]
MFLDRILRRQGTAKIDPGDYFYHGCPVHLSLGTGEKQDFRVHDFTPAELVLKSGQTWPAPKPREMVACLVPYLDAVARFDTRVDWVRKEAGLLVGLLMPGSLEQFERRKEPRARVSAPIFYAPVTQAKASEWGDFSEGKTIDLSASGAKFLSPTGFRRGEDLLLMLDLNDKSEMLRSVVVRVEEKTRYGFSVCVRFVNLSVAEQKILQAYVNRALDQP